MVCFFHARVGDKQSALAGAAVLYGGCGREDGGDVREGRGELQLAFLCVFSPARREGKIET